jgi:hypothetical protein
MYIPTLVTPADVAHGGMIPGAKTLRTPLLVWPAR